MADVDGAVSWAPMTGRTLALLVNPTSGKGRGGKNAPVAAHRLRERGHKVLELQGGSAQESLELARAAVNEGVDAVVACGGDGTVHLALQAVAGTPTPLGIIPVGTGDDNARYLRLPVRDAAAAADIVADGCTKTVDCGVVELADGTKEWFMGVLSAGFDSEVTERANAMTWPRGQARYMVAVIGELRVFEAVPFRLRLDDQLVERKAMLVAVGNGVSYGGGMRVCPDARMDDGELDVTMLGEVSKTTFLRSFPSVFKGTHTRHPFVYQYRAKNIELEAPGQIVYADGERVGPAPAKIHVEPASLKVCVSPHRH